MRAFIHEETVSLIIIDEVSMVTPLMLAMIDAHLKQLSGNSFKPFGGISILLVGDFFQIPPTLGTSLYKAAIESVLEQEMLSRSEFHLPFYQGIDLFKKFNLTTLTQQHRSKDEEHSNMIARLGKGEKLLQSDLDRLKRLSSEDVQDDPDWAFAPILTVTNREKEEMTLERALHLLR